MQKRDIHPLFQSNLIAVDGRRRVATFENLQNGESFEKEFNLLHVTPPMSAPDFIKQSPLANGEGWVDVDKFTLQHTRYANVFSLGDASSAPTSKTGAAIRRQGPVVIENLLAVMAGNTPSANYSGYASCPLVTGRGKCILAEFGYDGKVMETFPFDQAKERWTMYQLKRYFIPFMYWRAMMKGYF